MPSRHKKKMKEMESTTGPSSENSSTVNNNEEPPVSEAEEQVEAEEHAEADEQEISEDGAAEADEQEISEDGDDDNQQPRFSKDLIYSTEVHQTVKHETTPSPYAYFALNGKAYGISSDCTLRWTDNILSPRVNAIFTQSEEAFRGSIALIGRVKRDLRPEVNPMKTSTYTFAIDVTLMDIIDIDIHKPGDFEVPPYFNQPTDWRPDEIGLLTFTTTAARLSNPVVPKLLDPVAEEKLKALVEDFANIKKSNGLFKFSVLVDYYEDEEDGCDPLFEQTLVKRLQDIKEDPLIDWIGNSPNILELKQNNILGAPDRPALSNEHLVLGLRRGHRDMLDMKIMLVYGYHLEHAYSLGLATEISDTMMGATLTDVDGSKFALNKYDSNEPKLLRASIAWPSTLDRPKTGDVFEVVLPFKVPDAPLYDDPSYVRPQPAQVFTDDANIENADGDIILVGQTAEEKEDLSEERRTEYITARRHIWRGYYFAGDNLTVPGEVTLHLERPKDGLWLGPNELQPFVSTKIPVHPKNFSTQRYVTHVKLEATRHQISLTPITSDQTYRDVIRCLADFSKKGNSDQGEVRLSDHMASFALAGDLDLPFPIYNFLDFAVDDRIPAFLSCFTPYQKKRYLLTVKKIYHGSMIFEGCPAAGKTLAMEITALLWNTKPDQQFLWVTDTNAAVNEAATRVAQRARDLDLDKKLYVRVHNLDTEINKFQANYIGSLKHTTRHFDNVQDATHQAALDVDNIAEGHHERKKDKRWSNTTRDLDLCQALFLYCKDNKNDTTVLDLVSKLRNQNKNPTSTDNAAIKSLTMTIVQRVFKEADGLFTTCAMALQNKVHSYFRPSLILKDEDAKSMPQYTFALCGAYNPMFIALGGDTKQNIPFLQTATQVLVVNHFAKFCLYPTLQRFKEAGIPVYPFYQQHRMWHSKCVKFISEYFYNSAIIDGNLEKAEPPQVKFLRKFNKGRYNIDSNVILLNVADGKSVKEEGGTSLHNKSHIMLFVDYMQDLNAELLLHTDEALGFNKTEFTTGFLSAYSAQVALATDAIAKKNLQASAFTLAAVQGNQFDLLVYNILNFQLSEFAGDRRSNLVGLTRFKYGMVVLINQACTDPGTYKFSSRYILSQKENTAHVNAFYEWGLKEELVSELDAPDTIECNNCHEAGHVGRECPMPPDKSDMTCFNCGELGHGSRDCVHEKVEHSDDHVVCKRCSETGHRKINCPRPWCKQCRTMDHSHQDCPAKTCSKCKISGHRADDPINCPKYQSCHKCSGNHNAKHCNATITRASLLAANVQVTKPSFNAAAIERRYGRPSAQEDFVEAGEDKFDTAKAIDDATGTPTEDGDNATGWGGYAATSAAATWGDGGKVSEW